MEISLATVAASYRALAAALPGVDLHYAVKCLPYNPVLAELRSLGCGFEIASVAELVQLQMLGVDPAEVLFSNPVKAPAEIRRSYAAGVRQFAADSPVELDKLAAHAPGASVIVRLATSHGRGSAVASEGKFGVDAAAAVHLMLAVRERGLVPHGLAFHVGSQMLEPAAWAAPLRTAGAVMAELAGHGVFLRLIDVGGGFPVCYDVPPPPWRAYGAVIRAEVAALPYPVRVVAEPGRALVAKAGTLCATVIGAATRGRRRWVHLNVGAFNGLMESLETGNQLRFPVRDSRRADRRELCQLTGPSCDSQDTILFDVPLSVGLTVGDEVLIGCAGAYTVVYASTFNGFPMPTLRVVPG